MAFISQDYEDLLDKLRDLGVEKDVSLPQLVVMGDQSSGKSSVLERVSKIAFPRKCGLGTRCPSQIIMGKSDKPEAFVNIRWKSIDFKSPLFTELVNRLGQASLVKDGPSPHERHGVPLDPSDIGKAIAVCSEFITSESKSEICEDEIVVRTSGPDLPRLTIIDLPGLVHTVTDGQDKSLVAKTKSLVEKFCKQENTVILATIPANQDAATNQILDIAGEFDKERARTLGIITKPDLVDKGAETGVFDLANNRTIELKHGYFVVRCRGQAELDGGMNDNEANDSEKIFFEQSLWRDNIRETNRGIDSLCEQLSKLFVSHVEKTLPALKRKLREKLQAKKEKLTTVDIPLETDEERKGVWVNILKQVDKLIDNGIKGRYADTDKSRALFKDHKFRLRLNVQQHENDFQEEIAKTYFKCGDSYAPGEKIEVLVPDHPSGCTEWTKGRIIHCDVRGNCEVSFTPIFDESRGHFKGINDWKDTHHEFTKAKGTSESGDIVEGHFTMVEEPGTCKMKVSTPNILQEPNTGGTLTFHQRHDIECFAKNVPPDNIRRREINETLRNHIAQQLKFNRPDQLPGFLNYNVFETLMRDKIEDEWRPPAIDLLTNTHEHLFNMMRGIFDQVHAPEGSKVHAYLDDELFDMEEKILERGKAKVEERIHDEMRPHTLNHYFYSNVILSRVRILLRKGRGDLEGYGSRCFCAGESKGKIPCPPLDMGELAHAITGKLVNTQSNDKLEVLDMEIMLGAYWKLASKTFIDGVPKTINTFVLKLFKSEFMEKLRYVSDQKLKILFPVDQGLVGKRKEIKESITRLEMALKELSGI